MGGSTITGVSGVSIVEATEVVPGDGSDTPDTCAASCATGVLGGCPTQSI